MPPKEEKKLFVRSGDCGERSNSRVATGASGASGAVPCNEVLSINFEISCLKIGNTQSWIIANHHDFTPSLPKIETLSNHSSSH